jgi:WD40 repeat protein
LSIGAFFVLNYESLDILLEDRKARKTITDIKYSPNGHMIAMGSREGKVFLHGADNYSLIRTLQLPARRLDYCKFDFSLTGEYVRVATSSEDLFYYGIEDGNQITTTTATRDLHWFTCSCPLTWLSQGVPKTISYLPQCVNYSNGTIFVVGIRRPESDKAPIISSAISPDKSLIAVSYADGDVRLFRYPCVTQWVRVDCNNITADVKSCCSAVVVIVFREHI